MGTATQQNQLIKTLEELLKLPENRECVDCGTKAPRWASTNLGVFMCIRCSGIHRSLGVHISKVKSVSLDKWTPEQVEFMQRMGNAKGKEVYESYVPSNYNKGDIRGENIALEQWIRDKYERKRFIRRDGAEPITRSEYKERDRREPRDNYREREQSRDYQRDRGDYQREREHPREREREQPREREREQSREQPRDSRPLQAPQVQATRPVGNSKHPAPITAAGTVPAKSFDLLNWDEPAAPQPPPAAAVEEDLFGDFTSAGHTAAGPGGAPPPKDKNAILSLYHTPQQPLVGYHPGGPYPVMSTGVHYASVHGLPSNVNYPSGPHPGMHQPHPMQQPHPGMQYPGMSHPGAAPINYPAPNYNVNVGGVPPHMQGGYNNGPHPNYGAGVLYHGGQPNHYNPHANPNGGYAPNAYNNTNTNNMINGLSNLNLRM